MTALIFAPASGNQCREFQREAKVAAKLWGAEVVLFPPETASGAAAFVLNELAKPRSAKLTRVAFLCHGFRNRIQAGFSLANVATLALALRSVCEPTCTFSLYCCSTGRSATGAADGEGSFADAFRDALVFRGFGPSWMLTHTTAGHLARNPDVRMYRVDVGQTGGTDVCQRSVSKSLYTRFRGLLHTPTGRWDISTMSPAEIEAAAALCEPWTG